MSGNFASVQIEDCAAAMHRLVVSGSDKTPLKRNIICETCSIREGKTAYAAYGKDGERESWGNWVGTPYIGPTLT